VNRQFDHLEANAALFPNYRLFRGSVGATALRQRETFQYKGNLVGNSVEPLTADRDRGHLNVTFHHNWYFNVDQRMPRMRFGNAHVFNLIADSSAGQDLIGLSRAGVVATSGAAVRVENAWFAGARTPVSIQVGTEPPGVVLIRNSINYDPVTGGRARLDILEAAAGVTFAWNQPDPRTGINGWPAGNPEIMPAGYTPAGASLSSYLDSAEELPGHLMWVGVFVPADAQEAQSLRARWQSPGPTR
jgi:hypothetical protein